MADTDTQQVHLSHGDNEGAGEQAQNAGDQAQDTGDQAKDTGGNTGEDFEKKVAEERKNAGEGEEATEEELDKMETKLRGIIDNALKTLEPMLKRLVKDCTDAEEKHEKSEDFNEEQFVAAIKPHIEEAGTVLERALAEIQAIDPDKKCQRRAQRNAEDNKASKNQRAIADGLQKLSSEVQKTIDECKNKVKKMPHAKSELNNMFGMLSRPLFQILSAVGLLVYGVLNLLGQVLDALGLGGVLRGLMDNLGIGKLLSALGWKLQIVKTDKK